MIHDCDSTDVIQNDLYTSYDNSETDDNVSHYDPFCNNDDDQSIMFNNDLYKTAKLDDRRYHHTRLKSDS